MHACPGAAGGSDWSSPVQSIKSTFSHHVNEPSTFVRVSKESRSSRAEHTNERAGLCLLVKRYSARSDRMAEAVVSKRSQSRSASLSPHALFRLFVSGNGAIMIEILGSPFLQLRRGGKRNEEEKQKKDKPLRRGNRCQSSSVIKGINGCSSLRPTSSAV